jgi:anti-sigma factor RsiW
MKCEEALRLIEPAVEDELEPEYVTDFRQHIAGCDACREEFERAREFVAYLEGVPVPDPPDDLAASIKASIRHEAVRMARARWAGWLGAIGLPTLLAAFIYWFFPGGFAGFWSELNMLGSSWWRATLEFVSGSGQGGLVGSFKSWLPPGLAANWQLTLTVMVGGLALLTYGGIRYWKALSRRASWSGRRS